MENKAVKWKMLDYTHFTGVLEGYTISIYAGSPNHWRIYKDDEEVDNCYRHSPMYGEGSAKGQTQRILNQIIANATP